MEKKDNRGGARKNSGGTQDGVRGVIRINVSVTEQDKIWLSTQPGGISVSIRRLIREAQNKSAHDSK